MSVLLDGVRDLHAREALKGALRRVYELEQRLSTVEALNTVTFIPTGTGTVEYSATPATTGFEKGTIIAVKTASRYQFYILSQITAAGAVDWLPLTGKAY